MKIRGMGDQLQREQVNIKVSDKYLSRKSVKQILEEESSEQRKEERKASY